MSGCRAVVLMVAGLWLITAFAGWETALGVYLFVWGNNV